jgi:predicted amidohydrolase YtcJ
MRALLCSFALVLITGLMLCGVANAQSTTPADTILTNGQIYAADGSWAEALAIKGGVIMAVGDNAAVQPYRAATTKVIDLGGHTVLPGFHDMHMHPLGAGQALRSCVLKREATPSEIRETVSLCASKAKRGEWITGGSWVNDVFKTAPQDRALLDEAAPNNPVILRDETGHSSWANSLALKMAGITKETPNPLNGVIEHRPDGEPNGLLREAPALSRRTPSHIYSKIRRIVLNTNGRNHR